MIKQKIGAAISKLAAIGAVKRKGIGALSAYGGTIRGQGHVIHKSGPKEGTKTKFSVEGHVAAKN